MKLLVTAGNTQTPIDEVRCITNIFSGRTGAQIAAQAAYRGHDVTLLTSHPEVLPANSRVNAKPYRTFADLEALMETEITYGGYDAIVHAAAVSDFHVAGVFSRVDDEFQDVRAGKVKSSHPELWLKLTPAPKLVDCIRRDWNFHGVLVKFKLEVGVSEPELQAIAERSRQQSDANFMVANTLAGMHDWAILGNAAGYRKIARPELARRLLQNVEAGMT